MHLSFGVYMQDNQQGILQIPSLLNLPFMFDSYTKKLNKPPPKKKTPNPSDIYILKNIPNLLISEVNDVGIMSNTITSLLI